MLTCEFCKKDFSTKGVLLSHQKTTKYCLEIQGINIKNNCNFKCDYCDKTFTLKHNLNDHISICKQKKIKDTEDNKIKEYDIEIKKIKDEYKKEINDRDNQIQQIKDEYKKEIKQKDNEIKKLKDEYTREHKKEVQLLNQIITKLETKLESYEKRLFDMASRPNTTNTTNMNNNKTVVINTNIPLTNDVLRKCATTFTIDNARNIDGITKHFTSSLEDHITCTDPSRNVFKYTNDKDEEIVDTDLENLLPQYLTALKDENNFLYKEVFDYFKVNNVSLNEQTDYNIFYNALNAIIERKGQQNKYSDKMKKYIVRQCKKQFLEKNKNKEKEITKELTDEDIMMNIIKNGGNLYDFVDRLFDIEDIDNETEEQFLYRRKMEDLFKQKKKEWKQKFYIT